MIEALFFKAYYAYLDGNLKDTDMYLSFLRQECKLHPGENKLNEHYIPTFKNLITATKTGLLPQRSWSTDKIPMDSMGPKTKLSQVDIVKGLHKQCFSSIKDLLKAHSTLYLHNIEHPCPPYGAVDMLYQDQVTCYPLEVKKDRGEHDLIGQIMKYDLYCKKKLHLKHYYRVQPVTVCGSYDKFTLGQLKQLGVITIKYIEKNGDIYTSKI